ncbi:MAG: helix-turn-helix domain-containing protein [Deltaproteobacteria bacterium]|nr:helix-turn-helix domain-containing protein [Deltaproteobacteria bacterium]
MKAVKENIVYEQSGIRTLHPVVSTFDFNWHYHQEYEISLILEGTGLRYTGDTVEVFNGPELIFIPPEIPHSWQTDDREKRKEAVVIQFKHDFLGKPIIEIPDAAKLGKIFKQTTSLKFNITDKLIENCLSIHDSVGIERIINMLKLLKELASTKYVQANQYVQPSINQESEQSFNRVLSYIHKNWESQIQLNDLAKECAMSPSTFQRFFKRVTGRSFIDYLNVIKISKACELLQDDRYNILEISYKAGFRNLSFFNRKFKELKGMTPKNFRAQYQIKH